MSRDCTVKRRKKLQNSNLREKNFKDRTRRNGEKNQVRVNDCRRSSSRSRINSARRRQFGRRLSCENQARVALVATSYYYRARCCRECSRGGWYESPPPSSRSPFTRFSDARCHSRAKIWKPPPSIIREPRAFGGPSTLFLFAHSDICLSYIFALYRELPRFSGWRVARVRLCFPFFFSH